MTASARFVKKSVDDGWFVRQPNAVTDPYDRPP
jgi:hypothetical protein